MATSPQNSSDSCLLGRDPGSGFRRGALAEEAVMQPFADPTAHIASREEAGLRPGGYGLLVAGGTVDELIYSDIGNEVVLIKYTDTPPTRTEKQEMSSERAQPKGRNLEFHPRWQISEGALTRSQSIRALHPVRRRSTYLWEFERRATKR